MRKIISNCIGASFFALSSIVLAHHSVNVTFDASQLNELEGEIVDLSWRNPHITFTLAVDDGGNQTTWEIETHSVSILRRMEGIDQNMFQIGEKVKVAGHPSRNDANQLFVLNVLFANGQEVVLQPGSPPIFSGQTISSSGSWLASEDQAVTSDDGLFQTWTTTFTLGNLNPTNPDFPFTESAKEHIANFDPFTDSPTLNCNPKGMPAIMGQPYPIRFEDRDGLIVLYLEEYDTVRTIFLNDSNQPQGNSILGVSQGQWEGDTLVVRTENANWTHFNDTGIPLSLDATMLERFTPASDGSRLDYSIEITDPATFSDTVEMTKSWLAIPGVEVQPYECISN
jgi:hypothetical protein